MPATAAPLDGVTVLDLASVGPAARASRWLADYGATVIKVGPMPANAGVQITPAFHSYSAHRGLQRIMLDLKSPAGVETFKRLATTADVVIESFRPGVTDRLGIGYAALDAINPRIIYCSTTGFGQDGPRAQWAGHDLNYLAVSGFLSTTGRSESGKPPVPGATVADSAGGGLHALTAILAALVGRASSGSGQHLDVSIADGMLGVMTLQIDEYLATGNEPKPGSSLLTGGFACYDTYETRDGGWLAVAAIENRFWRNLCTLIGHEELGAVQMDRAQQPEIKATLAATFLTKDRDEWLALLADKDTCVSPVLSVAEAVDDEQYAARGMYAPVTHPSEPAFRQVAPTFAGMPRSESYAGRDMSQTDTDEVLAKAGFTTEEIAALREQGAAA